MTKTLLLLLIITAFACNNNKNAQPVPQQGRDLIMQQYFRVMDSFPFADTTDLYVRLLKAYYRNDTGYLRDAYSPVARMLDYQNFMLALPVAAYVKPLHKLQLEEVYRFRYNRAFCHQFLLVTVGKQADSFVLDCQVYNQPPTVAVVTLNSHTTHALTQQQWKIIEQGIKYADFWGLNADNGNHGLDGSSLFVSGYKRSLPFNKEKSKIIYRWSAEQTALGNLLQYVIGLSRVKALCSG